MTLRAYFQKRFSKEGASGTVSTLLDVIPGEDAIITGFSGIGKTEEKSLYAYGFLPGRRVQVLSQSPVTIVQIEQTELAFEGQIAHSIQVTKADFQATH